MSDQSASHWQRTYVERRVEGPADPSADDIAGVSETTLLPLLSLHLLQEEGGVAAALRRANAGFGSTPPRRRCLLDA